MLDKPYSDGPGPLGQFNKHKHWIQPRPPSEGTLIRQISSQINLGLRHVAFLSRLNSQDLQEKRLWYIRYFIQWPSLKGNPKSELQSVLVVSVSVSFSGRQRKHRAGRCSGRSWWRGIDILINASTTYRPCHFWHPWSLIWDYLSHELRVAGATREGGRPEEKVSIDN